MRIKDIVRDFESRGSEMVILVVCGKSDKQRAKTTPSAIARKGGHLRGGGLVRVGLEIRH